MYRLFSVSALSVMFIWNIVCYIHITLECVEGSSPAYVTFRMVSAATGVGAGGQPWTSGSVKTAPL